MSLPTLDEFKKWFNDGKQWRPDKTALDQIYEYFSERQGNVGAVRESAVGLMKEFDVWIQANIKSLPSKGKEGEAWLIEKMVETFASPVPANTRVSDEDMEKTCIRDYGGEPVFHNGAWRCEVPEEHMRRLSNYLDGQSHWKKGYRAALQSAPPVTDGENKKEIL